MDDAEVKIFTAVARLRAVLGEFVIELKANREEVMTLVEANLTDILAKIGMNINEPNLMFNTLEDWEWDAVIGAAKKQGWCVIGDKMAVYKARSQMLATGNVLEVKESPLLEVDSCWLCNGIVYDPVTISVEKETPNGKPCKSKEVKVHAGCYMDMES